MTSTPPRRGRPPKVPREHSDTREALLRGGMELLTEQNFAATGLDAVLKHVGVPKGSFYHYFDSKEAFGLAVLERYGLYFAHKLERLLTDAEVSPLARLERFVAEAGEGLARFEYRRGCLVGNLGQEVQTLPAAFRERLEAILQEWQQRLAQCLREAIAAGELHAQADPDMLAAFFWIGWEGAVLRARLMRSDAPLTLFHCAFVAGLPR